MNLISLYQYAEEMNILIFHMLLFTKKAFCIDDAKSYRAIVMNDSIIETKREEKQILAEEISHLEHNLTYRLQDIHNPNWLSNVRQCETRARCKAAVMQIPLEDLQKALLQTTEAWALAEILDVKESVVVDAVDYYKRKGLLK